MAGGIKTEKNRQTEYIGYWVNCEDLPFVSFMVLFKNSFALLYILSISTAASLSLAARVQVCGCVVSVCVYMWEGEQGSRLSLAFLSHPANTRLIKYN